MCGRFISLNLFSFTTAFYFVSFVGVADVRKSLKIETKFWISLFHMSSNTDAKVLFIFLNFGGDLEHKI